MNSAVIPQWTLADHLRKARQVAGMSQRQFADSIGVKSGAYAQWEAGNNRPRDVVTIAKRIELLTRIPASWILGVDEPTTDDHPPGAPLNSQGSAPHGGDGAPTRTRTWDLRINRPTIDYQDAQIGGAA